MEERDKEKNEKRSHPTKMVCCNMQREKEEKHTNNNVQLKLESDSKRKLCTPEGSETSCKGS